MRRRRPRPAFNPPALQWTRRVRWYVVDSDGSLMLESQTRREAREIAWWGYRGYVRVEERVTRWVKASTRRPRKTRRARR